MAKTDTHKLAEKIANLLESESPTTDLAGLFASLEKINHRLDKLERAAVEFHPEKHSQMSFHPSQEKFAVAEAIADEIFTNYKKEKACTFEPNGKPCDHCGMCSSRGF